MPTEQELENKAWMLRESGNPIDAIGLLLPLVFKYQDKANWQKVIDLLFEISISWKIHGRQTNNPIFYETSLQTLKHTKALAYKHNIELRNDWYSYVGEVQIAKGDFKDAIESFTKYEQLANLSEEEKANNDTQIGFAYAQLGEKGKGIEILRQSKDVLSHPQSEFIHEGMDVHAIWATGAMLKLAQVMDNKEEAKRLLEDALSIAKEKGLGAREIQINDLLKKI
jgi:tetratricopeptide (TPR) repeat protein